MFRLIAGVTLAASIASGSERDRLLNMLEQARTREASVACQGSDRGVYYRSSSDRSRLLEALKEKYGGLYRPYSKEFSAKVDCSLQIEHIVAVAEAYLSGMCSMSAARKREFATDVDSVTFAYSCVNGQKGDRDAASWVPAENRCWFSRKAIEIKDKYEMAVDEAEYLALRGIVNGCASFDLEYPRPGAGGGVRAGRCGGGVPLHPLLTKAAVRQEIARLEALLEQGL